MKDKRRMTPEKIAEEKELRKIAEEIAKHSPSLAHLLAALAPAGLTPPWHGQN